MSILCFVKVTDEGGAVVARGVNSVSVQICVARNGLPDGIGVHSLCISGRVCREDLRAAGSLGGRATRGDGIARRPVVWRAWVVSEVPAPGLSLRIVMRECSEIVYGIQGDFPLVTRPLRL